MLGHRIRVFLLSGLGAGLLPGAPGTWASGAAVLLWLAMHWLVSGGLTEPVRPACLATEAWITLLGVAVATITCIALAPRLIAAIVDPDPCFVTIDEFAGQWLALVAAGWFLPPLLAAGMAFALFRLFDIAKPWPCRRLERLPGGLGIMADDLMAGIYALACGQGIQVLIAII